MIFETHSHYTDKWYDEDRQEMLDKLTAENGIGYVTAISAAMDEIDEVCELAKRDNFFATIGVHPEMCGEMTEKDIEILKNLALTNEKVKAIGEIGLDYYWDEPERDIQKKWFRRQLELAKEIDYPVVIHSRDACADTMDIMKEYFEPTDINKKINGVIHCFSYESEVAREYNKLGFLIGVGGVVTFKNGRKLKEVVESIPLENIVVETDCPYMAPVPHRGERNSSLYIPYIIEEIAQIKGVSPKEVEDVTYKNGCRLYRVEG